MSEHLHTAICQAVALMQRTPSREPTFHEAYNILRQALMDGIGDPEPAQAQVSHGVRYATVRDAGDDEHWDIECRFVNGEKYAAVQVVKEKEQLADWIARALSAPLPDGRSLPEPPHD